jgi:tetratricopeptide (TPR) repeat protein
VRSPFAKLFKSLRASRLRKAISRYQRDPGRKSTLRLARLLLKLKRTRDALELTTRARQRFPGDATFQELHERVKQAQARMLRDQAMRALRAESSAENYVRVADLARALGDFDSALSHAEEALGRFPEHWAVHECFGKIHYYRFGVTREPSDSEAALEHLIRARHLNPTGYTTLVLLAMAAMRDARHDLAQSALTDLLRAYPQDPRARQLWNHAERLRSTTAPSEAATETDVTEPIRAWSSEAEGDGAESAGALAYFVFDDRGNLVDGQRTDNPLFDVEDRLDAIQDLAQMCRFDTQPLGVGELASCLVNGSSWRIVSRARHDRTIVAFYDKAVPQDDADQDASALLEESLVA